LSEFAVLVRAILADGKIHESERRLVKPATNQYMGSATRTN
jgi:uncharacterized tellurite resistance protein B-like protein